LQQCPANGVNCAYTVNGLNIPVPVFYVRGSKFRGYSGLNS